jgi:nicotinate (nicotinamide) nucleotide adenylyltransferase
MSKKIAVFGGSFNPPGIHHRAIAEELSRHFDEVIIVPCGPRPDKPTVSDIDPVHRAIMTDLAFSGLPRVRVDLFDLERAEFTRTHRLDEIYRREGEVWHVVGTDLLSGGHEGRSLIHRTWERGAELWHKLNFAVIVRDGHEIESGDLPARHLRFVPASSGSSSDIRERAFKRLPISGLVAPQIEDYIGRYHLYRGLLPPQVVSMRLDRPKALIFADVRNPRALDIAASLEHLADSTDPNCVIVVGGDGTMIKAIRQHWRRRLPFIGINAGHVGHLLNDLDRNGIPDILEQELHAHQLPLLYSEVVCPDGQRQPGGYAVNDAWVERAGGQAAWIRTKINGETRLPKLVADGALVATAAGSTAYARAMGAKPILIGSRELLLVGSNVSEPHGWRTASLPLSAEVEFEVLEPIKRPIRAYIDGSDSGVVHSLGVRVSRVAAAELAFAPNRDMAVKLEEHFFPSEAH